MKICGKHHFSYAGIAIGIALGAAFTASNGPAVGIALGAAFTVAFGLTIGRKKHLP